MIPTLCEISAANPYRMVQVDAAFDPRFNTPRFDASFASEYAQPFENSAPPYAMKIAKAFDEVCVQSHDNALTSVIKLLDLDGKIWATWNAAVTVVVPGKVAILEGVSYQLTTRHFVPTISTIPNLPNGRYRLLLENKYDTDGNTAADTTLLFATEILHIADTHPGTVVVQFRHSRNRHGLIFSQTGARFSFRVEGWVGDYSPDSRDVMYQDQDESPLLMSSTPSRLWGLFVDRVPSYLVEKLNYALACDDLRIDDEQYLKDPGAKWEQSGPAGSTSKIVKIAVRQRKNNAGIMLVGGGDIELYAKPALPYAVHSLRLVSPLRTVVIGGGRVINTLQEEADFITYLKATGRALSGLNGQIVEVGNSVRYRNAHDEYFTSASPAVLPGFVAVRRQLNSAIAGFGGAAINVTLHSPFIVMDWGDGTVTTHGSGTWQTMTASHTHVTYPSSQLPGFTRDIRIFYYDTLLERIGIADARTVSVFNPLPRALRNFAIVGGGLQTVASALTSPFYQLQAVALFGNKLPFSQVNNVFNNIVANSTTIVPGGAIAIQDQTPAAAPTSLSLAARQTLQSAGWNLTHD